MAIKVLISRRVPTALAANANPMLLQLRSLAMGQPGYISGETLLNVDDREELMVLSTWATVEHWKVWETDPRRTEVESTLNTMLSAPPQYKVYYYG